MTARAKSTMAPAEFERLREHVMTCSKCGFCQPSCPIFRATGREAFVARGKVALYRTVLEERTQIGPEVKEGFDNCLLCRACADNCFPSIKTDEVVVSFRHAYAERFGRGFLQRRVFRSLLPRPGLMRGLVRFVWAFRKTGMVELARRAGLIGMLNPKLERALELGAGKPGALLTSRLQKRARPAESGVGGDGGPRASRPHIGYWMSCGYNYVLPEVGEATVRVLDRMGFEVEVLDNCCCGMAAYGYGDIEAAVQLAKENLRRLGDLSRYEALVSECGSCSGHLKEYARLLAGEAEWAERAEALQMKVRSFSEFVVERGFEQTAAETGESAAESRSPAGEEEPDGEQHPAGERHAAGEEVPTAPRAGPTGAAQGAAPQEELVIATYHDPCHLGRRYQDVVEQPRRILRSLPGVTLVEMEESDSCCGAAGTYGVLHPETSGAIVDRKTGFLKATGASVIVTECPSCMMQLRYGAKRAGLEIEVRNVSQMCDEAMRKGKSAAEKA